MIKIRRKEGWYKYLEINKLILYDFTWKWWIWGKDTLTWEDTIFWWLQEKYKRKFNLSDPIERQLSRINDFYEVLNGVYNDRLQILYDSVYYDKEERVKEAKRIWKESKGKIEMILLDWSWDGMEQWAYGVFYDYDEEKIYYRYYDMDMEEEEGIYWTLTREEFNLLMQIYYWVYDDEKLKKELEEKERRWEYEEMLKEWKELEKEQKEHSKKSEKIEKEKWLIERIKYDDKFYKEYYEKKKEEFMERYKKKWEEYLKLQLLRKPTDRVFPELKIRKIYDRNWDKEEQRKVVEKINKELGKEVVVLEE